MTRVQIDEGAKTTLRQLVAMNLEIYTLLAVTIGVAIGLTIGIWVF